MIDDLKAFVAAVDGRSLTKAASKLNLTQSAISRRIQQLEDVLGATLLDRAQRPLTSTPLGNRIYERAVPILRAIDDLLATTREHGPPSGTLRIGVAQAIGDAILAGAVGVMKTDFPQLDLRLRTEWSAALTDQVTGGDLDAAFIMLASSAKPPETLLRRYLGSLEVVVVQSRRHALFRQPVRLAALITEAWILNPLGCGYRAGLESAMGEKRGALRVAVDAYGSEFQLRLIASGLGLGLVPRSVLRASTHRDDISTVDVTDFSLKLDIWLVHLADFGNLLGPVEAFEKAVAEGFVRYEPEKGDTPTVLSQAS